MDVKSVRMFIAGFLVCATTGAAVVYAQSLGALAPEANRRLERVNFRAINAASGYYVGRIDMGDGTAYYVASSVRLATTLESLSQMIGLGCVRE